MPARSRQQPTPRSRRGAAPSFASPLPEEPLHGTDRLKEQLLVFSSNSSKTNSGTTTALLHPVVQHFVKDFFPCRDDGDQVYEKMGIWQSALTATVEPELRKCLERLRALKVQIEAAKVRRDPAAVVEALEDSYRAVNAKYECIELDLNHFLRELKAAATAPSAAALDEATRSRCAAVLDAIQREKCARGYGLELVNGDTLDVDVSIAKHFSTTGVPQAVAVIGPQSSGKSTLLDVMFNLKLPTSATRCTKGINVALAHVHDPDSNELRPLLQLDSEGLLSTERSDPLFDKHVTNILLSTCSTVIINVKGQLLDDMKNYLDIFTYCANHLQLPSLMPNLIIVLRDMAMPCDLAAQRRTLEETLLNRPIDVTQPDGTTQSIRLRDLVQWKDENLFALPSAFNEPVRPFKWMSRSAPEYERYQQTEFAEGFISGCIELARLVASTPPHTHFAQNVKSVGDCFSIAKQRVQWNKKHGSLMDCANVHDINENTAMNITLQNIRFGFLDGDGSPVAMFVKRVRGAFSAAAKNKGAGGVDLSGCKLGSAFDGSSFTFSTGAQVDLMASFDELFRHTLAVPETVDVGHLDDTSIDGLSSVAFRLLREKMREEFPSVEAVRQSRLHRGEEQCYDALRATGRSLAADVRREISAMETRNLIERETQAAFDELLAISRGTADGRNRSMNMARFNNLIERVVRECEERGPQQNEIRRRILSSAQNVQFFQAGVLEQWLGDNEELMAEFTKAIDAHANHHRGSGGAISEFSKNATLVQLILDITGAKITAIGVSGMAQTMLGCLVTALASLRTGTGYTEVLKTLEKNLQPKSIIEHATAKFRDNHYLLLHQLCIGTVLFAQIQTEYEAGVREHEETMAAVRRQGDTRRREVQQTCSLIANFSPQESVKKILQLVVSYHADECRREIEKSIDTPVREEIITTVVVNLLNDLLLHGDRHDDFFGFIKDPNGTIERYYTHELGKKRADGIVARETANLRRSINDACTLMAKHAKQASFDGDSRQLVEKMLPSKTNPWVAPIRDLLERACTGSKTDCIDRHLVAGICKEIEATFDAATPVAFDQPILMAPAEVQRRLRDHFYARVRGGCRAHCPYCRTICTADHVSDKDAKCESVLHLFDGMGSWHNVETKVLNTNLCTFAATNKYKHEDKYYPFIEHLKLANPEWVIKKSPEEFDIKKATEFEKALVRAYIKLNARLAAEHSVQPAVIPQEWLDNQLLGRRFVRGGGFMMNIGAIEAAKVAAKIRENGDRQLIFVSGAFSAVEASSGRRDRSQFLEGVDADCKAIHALRSDAIIINNRNITKDQVVSQLESNVREARSRGKKIMLVYSGHGRRSTVANENGAWVFNSGRVADETEYLTGEELMQLVQSQGAELDCLVSDSCFSGAFCASCIQFAKSSSFVAYASSNDLEMSYDSKFGGHFIRMLFNHPRDSSLLPSQRQHPAFYFFDHNDSTLSFEDFH